MRQNIGASDFNQLKGRFVKREKDEAFPAFDYIFSPLELECTDWNSLIR